MQWAPDWDIASGEEECQYQEGQQTGCDGHGVPGFATATARIAG